MHFFLSLTERILTAKADLFQAMPPDSPSSFASLYQDNIEKFNWTSQETHTSPFSVGEAAGSQADLSDFHCMQLSAAMS